jgi:hypothetical protein
MPIRERETAFLPYAFRGLLIAFSPLSCVSAYLQCLNCVSMLWQARRDSNPHHPDLESGALTVGATGLQRGCPALSNAPVRSISPNKYRGETYLVSLCSVCVLQNLQYFLNDILSGVLRLFFVVV